MKKLGSILLTAVLTLSLVALPVIGAETQAEDSSVKTEEAAAETEEAATETEEAATENEPSFEALENDLLAIFAATLLKGEEKAEDYEKKLQEKIEELKGMDEDELNKLIEGLDEDALTQVFTDVFSGESNLLSEEGFAQLLEGFAMGLEELAEESIGKLMEDAQVEEPSAETEEAPAETEEAPAETEEAPAETEEAPAEDESSFEELENNMLAIIATTLLKGEEEAEDYAKKLEEKIEELKGMTDDELNKLIEGLDPNTLTQVFMDAVTGESDLISNEGFAEFFEGLQKGFEELGEEKVAALLEDAFKSVDTDELANFLEDLGKDLEDMLKASEKNI